MNRSFRLLLMAPLATLALLIVPVGAQAVAPQVSVNYSTVCTLSDVGEVKCAGYNVFGTVGIGNFLPVAGFQNPLISGVTQLAATDNTNCAIKTDTTVWCWGENDDFELGQGGVGEDDSAVPVQVKAVVGNFVTGAVQISGQDGTFCALKSDTTAVCWGRGTDGQLGDGGTTDLSLASQVWTGSQNLSGIRKIVPGRAFTCAVMLSGGVKCWGNDADAALGNGAGGNNPFPGDVEGITNAVDIGGGSNTACALLADASMKCWGDNAYGNVGNGAAPTDAQSPVTVLTGVRKISVGYQTVCAQPLDLSLKCWGQGSEGVFLEPAKTDRAVPTTVAGISRFIQMSENFEATFCVLYRGGAVSCWGNDDENQIGVPPNSGDDLITPATLPQDLVTLAYPGEATAVSLAQKTKVDKKKKTYTLTTQLTTTPNLLVAPTEACTGATRASVKYSYTSFKTVKSKGKKKRKKIKKTKTVKKNGVLGLSGATCVSTLALKLPVKYLNAKKVTVIYTAAGNASLQPISTSTKFKLPKVKIKKKK
jgi:alpha-tubulin suppressor-like RCC1 family protein